MKSFTSILISIYFTIVKLPLPIHPSSTLIFSFLGSSAPSYVVVFTRQKVQNVASFFRDVLSSSVPQSILIAAGIIFLFHSLKNQFYSGVQINTAVIMLLLVVSLLYSLLQIWLSGKLKSLTIAALIFVILTTVGVFQTILPITQYTNDIDRIAIASIVTIGGFILLGTLWFLTKPKTLQRKFLTIIVSLIGVPIVLYFPFADYYKVIRLSPEIYKEIGLVSLLVFIGIIIVTKIFRMKSHA